jgi:hypothetical protein
MARWICEQAHLQLKEEFGLDHFEGRSWHGLHRHALMTMIAYAFLQYRRIAKRGGKKKRWPPPQPSLPAARPPSSLSFFGHQIRDTHTAEDRSAKSNGVNESAKVVLADTRSVFMIVQETGDPRLQQGGVVRFARGRVLEEPAPDVSRQIIPFADKGGTQTFQDSALHVVQIAGFIG